MPTYNCTGRFWLVLILTICVLCSLGACGGSSSDDPELEPEPPIVTVPPTDGVIYTPTVPAPKTRI